MNREGLWSDHVARPLSAAGPGHSGAHVLGPSGLESVCPGIGERRGREGPASRGPARGAASPRCSLCAAAAAPRQRVRRRGFFALGGAGFLVFLQTRVPDTPYLPAPLLFRFYESATPERILRLRRLLTVSPSS